MTGVHIAAYFRLREAIMALLGNGHDLDTKDNVGGEAATREECRAGV
jgi:hypothetical protein